MPNTLNAILSLLTPVAMVGGTVSAARSGSTLEDLQHAFNAESNAKARYLTFARKADEEGFGEVAGLFLAAAKAEEIHARNHATVIRHMGGIPHAHIEPVSVKTTRESIKAAIEVEKYERDVMYPELIDAAKRQKTSEAFRSFTLALKVEAVHAVLCQDALDNLERLRGKWHTYYVCPECGNTLAELTILDCIVCGRPKSGFIAIN
jgi:rubrerythrin